MAKRLQNQKEEERVVSKSRPAVMNMSSHFIAKRMQEQKGEERSVAKSKSTSMNQSSRAPTSSSSATSPIASKGPVTLIATGKPESRMRRNSKSDAASSSQVRLQDAYLGGLMYTATGKLVASRRGTRECGPLRI